jgi:hypothetical protein
MNIRMTPFLLSSGIAAAVLTLLAVITAVVGFLSIPADLSDFLENPEAMPTGWMQISSLVGCLTTLLTGGGYIGAGVLYAYFHHREERVAADGGAIGGAAASAVASIIAAVAAGMVSMLITPLILERIVLAPGLDSGLPADMLPTISGMFAVGGVIGTLTSACCGTIFAALLGAAGGAIAGALLSNRERTPAPIDQAA